VCCKSGEYVKSGYCGCCLHCAKAEGEECGGDWEERGRCATGMHCRASSADGPGKCRKPAQLPLGPKIEKSELLSNSHEPSKPKIIAAPVCPSGKTAKDMTCHCSKEPAVQGIDGNSRGGCVPSPNQEEERVHGWCFLENIRNPGNGTEYCFEDAKWSVVDGRFWSNMACIDEYKKKEEEKIKSEELNNIPIPAGLNNIPIPDDLYRIEQIQTTTETQEMYTNPPGCPLEQPLFCLPAEEGQTCSYGSQSCCGEITPMVTVECKKGSWWPSMVSPDIRCRFGYEEC